MKKQYCKCPNPYSLAKITRHPADELICSICGNEINPHGYILNSIKGKPRRMK